MTPPLVIQGEEHKVDFCTTQEEFDCQKYLGQCLASHKGNERKILGLTAVPTDQGRIQGARGQASTHAPRVSDGCFLPGDW